MSVKKKSTAKIKSKVKSKIKSKIKSKTGSKKRERAAQKVKRRAFKQAVKQRPKQRRVKKRSGKTSVSQEARLETQSAQAQKMQAVGQLAGGIAHDFNNILTAIITACDLVPRGISEVGEIRSHAERGANLVRQLLAFSRRQTLRPVRLDSAAHTRDICVLIERLLGAPIRLELDIEEEVWPVLADPTQFEQIIVNLAVNARDAMKEGGVLGLRIKNISAETSEHLGHILLPIGDYVLFELSDTGCGIAQGEIGNIFEPFYSTKVQGSGLGLSTVYGIVKQSNGFIFPQSTEGEGTVFRIYLPRLQELEGAAVGQEEDRAVVPAAQPPQPKSAERLRASVSGKVILLVEDEPAIREFVQRALRAHGFEVICASSAEEALALQRGQVIDMLVSDVVMSGMDGVKLAEQLLGQHPGLKVILISGYAEEAFQDPQARFQQVRFLPKPFGLRELILAVSTALDNNADKVEKADKTDKAKLK